MIKSHILYPTLRAKLHIFIQMTRVIVCFSYYFPLKIRKSVRSYVSIFQQS